MALSSHSAHAILATTAHSSSSSSSHNSSLPKLLHSQHHNSSLNNTLSLPSKPTTHNFSITTTSDPAGKWRTNVSFFPSFFINKTRDAKPIKEELLEAIEPLDRGVDATSEDQQRIDQIARKLEAVNPTKQPLKSDLLNGKWELVYTTSRSILQAERPKFLRSRTNYQGINVDTLRAQNMESWPFFNQVTADLTPLNPRKVAVKFDYFKIAGLIPIKAPGRARGELEITYLDEELRFDGVRQAKAAVQRQGDARGPQQQAAVAGPPPRKINLISCEPMAHVSDIKLIRTDTTLDLSQKAEKGYQEGTKGTCSS